MSVFEFSNFKDFTDRNLEKEISLALWDCYDSLNNNLLINTINLSESNYFSLEDIGVNEDYIQKIHNKYKSNIKDLFNKILTTIPEIIKKSDANNYSLYSLNICLSDFTVFTKTESIYGEYSIPRFWIYLNYGKTTYLSLSVSFKDDCLFATLLDNINNLNYSDKMKSVLFKEIDTYDNPYLNVNYLKENFFDKLIKDIHNTIEILFDMEDFTKGVKSLKAMDFSTKIAELVLSDNYSLFYFKRVKDFIRYEYSGDGNTCSIFLENTLLKKVKKYPKVVYDVSY